MRAAPGGDGARRGDVERALAWFTSGLSIVSALPPPAVPLDDDRIAAILATGLLGLPFEAMDEGVNRALAVLGIHLEVDRAFYYRADEAAGRLTMTHEWASPGVRPMKPLPEFSDLPIALIPAAFLGRLRHGTVLRLPRTRGLLADPVEALVRADQDRAIAVVPALLDGALLGLCGFAGPAEIPWEERHVALLQIIARGIARIVERRGVENALRAGEARFRTICEASPVGIFLSDDRGGCAYINPAAQKITGLTAEAAMGQGWMSALHEEDRARIVGRWTSAVGAPERQDYRAPVHRFVHPRGEIRSVLVHAVPLAAASGRGGFLGILEDVTERLRSEQERNELLARVEAARASAEAIQVEIANVLSRISDGFVALDRGGCFTYANDRALAIMERKRDDLLGRPLFAEFPAAVGTRFEGAYRQAVLEQQATSSEECFLPTQRWYESRFYPSPNGVSIFFEDVTDRKQREEQLRSDRDYLKQEIGESQAFHEIVGLSPALKGVSDAVAVVAGTNTTVLITGETGTGKELVARAIHDGSPRREGLLVNVNCAAISSGLVESELFGHEKGAFTGALQRHRGRFELAHHGTLFLDEVSELPLETQAKLLRVLQERELERVGGTETIRVDVRVVAATNRNLAELVASGRFREDLYYRLAVFPVPLPPLRERRSDIPLLVHAFVQRFARQAGRRIEGVSGEVMRRLSAYHWPGNVRELQNVIERAVILTRGLLMEIDALPELTPAAPAAAQAQGGNGAPGTESIEAVERTHVERVLRETGWVIEGERGAAQRLGLHPNTLRSRLKRWGVVRPRPASR
jgi:PAS domain S-box-containing protein